MNGIEKITRLIQSEAEAEINNVLEKAREEAAKTLADVRKAMKIDYFDDAELIAEHTKKYQG